MSEPEVIADGLARPITRQGVRTSNYGRRKKGKIAILPSAVMQTQLNSASNHRPLISPPVSCTPCCFYLFIIVIYGLLSGVQRATWPNAGPQNDHRVNGSGGRTQTARAGSGGPSATIQGHTAENRTVAAPLQSGNPATRGRSMSWHSSR